MFFKKTQIQLLPRFPNHGRTFSSHLVQFVYSTSWGYYIFKHNLQSMFYADDAQLYIVCSHDGTPSEKNENWISEIRQWMHDNMLVFNDSKTEVIRFSSKFGNGDRPRECSVQVGDVSVHSSSTVRDLGVTFDISMTMMSHVSNLCKSAYFA